MKRGGNEPPLFLCSGMAFRVLSTLIVALPLLAALVEPARALDFSCPDSMDECSPSTIWLSGKIVDGDARRFFLELNRRGPVISTVVFFDSDGGLTRESIRIGHLIRQLKLRTVVGFVRIDAQTRKASPETYYPHAAYKNPDGSWMIPSLDRSLSVCASACVYMWLGGYQRLGVFSLQVHSGRYDVSSDERNAIPSWLTVDRLAGLLKAVSEVEQAFLREMMVPESFWTQAEAVPNAEIKTLKMRYVDQALGRMPVWLNLAMRGTCGETYPAWNPVTLGTVSFDEVAELSQCEEEINAVERREAWDAIFAP